jgi:hypothetical protein
MAEGPTDQLKANDARWTYRYLRIGMIGAVVLLAVSIWLEWRKVSPHCFQDSISAYYYTPVRAIFVGFLFAISLTLIVYKGRDFREDLFLTFSGILGPVVAVAPTTDFGRCWSVPPNPLPVMEDGSLAPWVVTNIENNFQALMIVGIAGLIASTVIALVLDRETQFKEGRRKVWIASYAVGGLFGVAWWSSEYWDEFHTRAHGFAAVGMILFLGIAILFHAYNHWREGRTKRDNRLIAIYLGIAGAMALGGAFISWTRIFGERTVFFLEAWEILLFAVYWIVQTKASWDEEVVDQFSTTKPAAAEPVSGPKGASR